MKRSTVRFNIHDALEQVNLSYGARHQRNDYLDWWGEGGRKNLPYRAPCPLLGLE